MRFPHARRALPLALALLLFPAVAHAEVVPGEIVVRFAPDASRAEQADVLTQAGAEDSTRLPLPDTHVVQLAQDGDERGTADRLEDRDDVLWAEPNYVVHADLTPNDPSFLSSLWGLNNTGQSLLQAKQGVGYAMTTGSAGIDIGAPAAWDTTTGSASVLVGVVDTGVASHRDLDANVNGGLSRDFRDHGANAIDDPRADADSHGTHVAGTIGAVGDNATDVTGVAWHTGLVALRVLDAGSGSSADVAAAFAYAGANGIPIVNASLGGPDNSTAIRDAIANSPNTLFVVAAGNDNANVDATPTYPCAYTYANLICVASIDNDGARSYFSNYGATAVDLGAPGNGIVSTVPAYTTSLTSASNWPHTGDWTWSGSTWMSSITPSMSSSALTSPVGGVSLVGQRGCSVTASLVSSIPSGQGRVIFERSIDGGATWDQIGVRDTPTTLRTVDFAVDADEQASVRVRVRVTTTASAPTTSNAVLVSGLKLQCVTPGASSATAMLSGTSMATPMVAGVAALLLASKPTATVAELRTALLSSVTPMSSLTTTTTTGGRVDAEAALYALAHPPTPPVSGGGFGGGGGGGGGAVTTPTPAPTPTPTPITIPTPVAPTTVPTPAKVAPTATWRVDADDLLDDGRLTLRVGVSADASVRATAGLSWPDGHTTLSAVTRSVSSGDSATLRLRVSDRGLRAARRARKAGRRVTLRVVLTVTGSDGASRQVERSVSVR